MRVVEKLFKLEFTEYLKDLPAEERTVSMYRFALDLAGRLAKNGKLQAAAQLAREVMAMSTERAFQPFIGTLEQLVLDLAGRLKKGGDQALALAILEKLTTLSPQCYGAWFRLGEHCRSAKITEKAVHAYKQASEGVEYRAPASFALAKLSMENGLYSEAMLNTLEAFEIEQDHSVYFQASRLLNQIDDSIRKGGKGDEIRIAVLSSFTMDNMLPVLEIECRLAGHRPVLYKGAFNQFAQEILNANSEFYAFKPDIVILAVQPEVLTPELGGHLPLPEDTTGSLVEKVIEAYAGLISSLQQNCDAYLFISNFIVPSLSAPELVLTKGVGSRRRLYRELNRSLDQRIQECDRICIVDIEAATAKLGKNAARDERLYYLGSMQYSPSMALSAGRLFAIHVNTLSSPSRKCLVLDLDDTLWGGVIGEDGLEGIRLGPTFPGNVFYDFQSYILGLFERGVILAVNSKNNPEDAFKMFRAHPHMVLKEEHFAAMRVNWQDKVANLREIAAEINIGLDSLVFVDDNPVERALVKQMLPEVLTVDLPEDPERYIRALSGLSVFERLSLTTEDRQRGRMYAADSSRKTLRKTAMSREDFIRSLEMELTIKEADDFSIPRVAQLTQRTNQFNLTTKRYSEADIRRFGELPGCRVYTLNVRDKFGDTGLVGVAITVSEEPGVKAFDTFLMSCRVLGREAEHIFLRKIMGDLAREGTEKFIGYFAPTQKNKPAENFYPDNAFKPIGGDGGIRKFEILSAEGLAPTSNLARIIEE